MGKRGKGKPKKRTLMRAFLNRLRLPAEDGQGGTNYDLVARAWVTALQRGDTAALKLALDRIDGPTVRKQEVAHTSRLIVSPGADPRAIGPRVVELGSPDQAASAQPDHNRKSADADGGERGALGADADARDAGSSRATATHGAPGATQGKASIVWRPQDQYAAGDDRGA